MSFINKLMFNIFSVQISKVDLIDDIFTLDKYQIIKKNSSCLFNPGNLPVTKADPFLFEKDGILYLFYEEQKRINQNGVIKMTFTTDLVHWSKPKTVLEEKIHLSFPFVFQIKGENYMIPETSEENCIRLYKGSNDLIHWKSERILLKGDKFVDTSIFYHQELFYLFTSIQTSDNNYSLMLYFSDSLSGNWIQHPKSPIQRGKLNARNGGALICINNEIYRPAQNAEKIYGGNLGIYKIIQLSKTEYVEEIIKSDIFSNETFFLIGGHHINFIKYKNMNIVATDLLQKSFNLSCIMNRIKDKIKL